MSLKFYSQKIKRFSSQRISPAKSVHAEHHAVADAGFGPSGGNASGGFCCVSGNADTPVGSFPGFGINCIFNGAADFAGCIQSGTAGKIPRQIGNYRHISPADNQNKDDFKHIGAVKGNSMIRIRKDNLGISDAFGKGAAEQIVYITENA